MEPKKFWSFSHMAKDGKIIVVSKCHGTNWINQRMGNWAVWVLHVLGMDESQLAQLPSLDVSLGPAPGRAEEPHRYPIKPPHGG